MSRVIGLADVYGRPRAAVRKAGTQKAYAEQFGISASFVSQVLNGHKPPTDAMLAWAGIKRVVQYVVEE